MGDGVRIDVRTNVADVQRELRRLQSDIQQRAIARALNRTMDQGQTQMVRAIASEFEIKQSEVRARLSIRRAREGYFGGLLTVDLFAFQNKRGRGFNLIRFVEKRVTLAEAKRRQKAGTLNQLGFRIKKGGGIKRIQGAFIGNKGRTVFMREGDARLPIKAVTTIDVPQMFNTRRINSKVVKYVKDKFPEVLAREVDYYVKRFG